MRTTTLILAALILLGCQGDPGVVHRPGEPAVVNFDAEDPEMEAAIWRARSSFSGFVSKLPELREKGDYFSVKVPIESGTGREHIWLSAPEVREGQVEGALGNVPLAGPHKLGDSVSVPIGEISDWMAVVDNELYGGFSVLVVRKRMSPAEREEFDRSVGFRVPQEPRQF